MRSIWASVGRLYLHAIVLAMAAPANAEMQMWVASDSANRRTCPSVECGVVGKLFFRELATVFETRNGWARVSEPYHASCVDGKSEYVDEGRADCTPDNGIADGQFAEWIRLDLLSKQQAPDPGADATGTAKLVAPSDDFRHYKSEFVRAAEALIASGQCTAKDLDDAGGFVKSSNKGGGIYFTFCRGGSDRIYLDVMTGRTFR